MKYKDYYEILGVPRTATAQEIKAAYRKLARKYHPDVNKATDAGNKFKDLNEAYEVLSDKQKKQRYDSLGASWNQESEFTPPPGYENFGQGFSGFGGARGFSGSDFGEFSDFFESIFGEARGQSQHSQQRRYSHGPSRQSKHQEEKPKNPDITEDLLLEPEDLMIDSSKSIRVSYMDKCSSCSGRGSNCYICGGSGYSTVSKVLNVKIPKGIKEGAKIRLSNEGRVDDYGNKGDLFLIVKFKEHPDLKIEGNEVTSDLEISPPEAVFGTISEVKTLHGVVKVTVPAGTQSGKQLRLKGLGIPLKTGGFGYHIAKIKIVVPQNLTAQEIELYRKLLELSKK